MERFAVTLPSPLPWRISFVANMWSFNGDRLDLRAAFRDPASGHEICWEGSCDADDLERNGDEDEPWFPGSNDPIRVTLEPLR